MLALGSCASHLVWFLCVFFYVSVLIYVFLFSLGKFYKRFTLFIPMLDLRLHYPETIHETAAILLHD